MITRDRIDNMELDELAAHIKENPQDAYRILNRVALTQFWRGEEHGRQRESTILGEIIGNITKEKQGV